MPTYVANPDYAIKAGYEQPKWDRNADHWEFPFWDPQEMTWSQWHTKWGHLGEVDPLGRKRYLANLMAMDDGITQILDTLEKTGQRENTIVIFLSDNGGTINTYSNNTPLRGYKYMFGEGGVRIRMIVSWPGKLPKQQTRSSLASAMDLFPTLIELIGGEVPSDLDGKSLVTNIRKDNPPEVHDYLCFADGRGTWSVRQGDWKLINSKGWVHSNYQLNDKNIASLADDVVYPTGLLLYNLKTDIKETKDLASSQPERVAKMKALYEAWQKQMGKPRSGKVKKN
ncbi:MAG: sulfatase family protein [Pirellulales bacterium]|jgi:arylsulfatase A-like enzyme